MEIYLLIFLIFNLVMSIFNLFKKREFSWLQSTLGWTAALCYFILHSFY